MKRPEPGAVFDGHGTTFCTWSQHARQVWLCLLERDAGGILREARRLAMQRCSGFYWVLHVAGCKPGQCYGYRAEGDYAPKQGHFFNPARLLLDPWARRVEGEFDWHAATLGQPPEHPDFHVDSLGHVPCSVVVAPLPPLDGVRPATAWEDTVIYETHVKGLTCLHPDIPAGQRGRYSALAHPVMIEHFRRLGITAIQLLPVHTFVDELHLVQNGLRNYWGYNPLVWFAPSRRYAEHDAISEFRSMVSRLHEAGIEVILDVVFNHTAEGDQRGPTLSLRGLDNAVFYRRAPGDDFVFANDSGCGNTLDTRHPVVLQMILDCLRFWASVMGVDGFRFDLATALGRHGNQVDHRHPLWLAILQDPLLRHCKWIVEPWDLGNDGYQLGRFPEEFSEWNDQFRIDLRRYVRGDEGMLGNMAKRLAGSWDLFAKTATGARASINYIAAHDGFTLRDLVSYSHKHNLANGEHNRDGSHENYSTNCGVEGDADDAQVLVLRARQQRNFLVLLILSQGVPMLLHGDENGRTQSGNNNAYCQDNALAWCHWPADEVLNRFAAALIHARRRWGIGRVYAPCIPLWQQINERYHFLRPDGGDMQYEDWAQRYARSVAILVTTPVTRVLLLCNMHWEAIGFRLPAARAGCAWELHCDTFFSAATQQEGVHAGSDDGEHYLVQPASIVAMAEINPA